MRNATTNLRRIVIGQRLAGNDDSCRPLQRKLADKLLRPVRIVKTYDATTERYLPGLVKSDDQYR